MATPYDLEQQEQLEQVKHLWSRWGNLITGVMTLVMLAFAGWNGWHYWQRQQAAEASTRQFAMFQALQANNFDLAQKAALDLRTDYAGTYAASTAQLSLAKAALLAQKPEVAKASLNWLVEHAHHPALADLARWRLAGIWLEEGKPEQAKALLQTQPAAAYSGLYEDRLGDAAVVNAQAEQAIVHYQQAWKLSSEDPSLRQVIAIKLATLGVDANTLK